MLKLSITLAFLFVIATLLAQSNTWTRLAGGSGEDIGYALATDSHGNIYCAGYTSATTEFVGIDTSFTGYPLPTVVQQTSFMMKLDSLGQLLWFKPWNLNAASGVAFVSGVRPFFLEVDAADNVYVGSNYIGNAMVDTVALIQDDQTYGAYFFVKYNEDGNLLWLEYSDTIGYYNSIVTSMDIADDGTIWATIYNEDVIEVDDQLLTGSQVVALNADGNLLTHNYTQGVQIEADATHYYLREDAYHIGQYTPDHQLQNTCTTTDFIGTFDLSPDGTIIIQHNLAALMMVSKFTTTGEELWQFQVEAGYPMSLDVNELGESAYVMRVWDEEEANHVFILDPDGVVIRDDDFCTNTIDSSGIGICYDAIYSNDTFIATGLQYCCVPTEYLTDTLMGIGNVDLFLMRAKTHDLDTFIVSISELEISELHVFPNPATDYIRISGLETNSPCTVEVFNTSANLVYSTTQFYAAYDVVSVAALAAGVYVLRLTEPSSNKVYSFTFIKP